MLQFHLWWLTNISVALLPSCLCLHGSFSVLSVMCTTHWAGSVRGQADTACSLLPLDWGLLITRLMKAQWIQLLSQIPGWFFHPHWSLADTVILSSATNSPLLSRWTNWIDLLKQGFEICRDFKKNSVGDKLIAAPVDVVVEEVLLEWKLAWWPEEGGHPAVVGFSPCSHPLTIDPIFQFSLRGTKSEVHLSVCF